MYYNENDMVTANELQIEIIHLINGITNIQRLSAIHADIQSQFDLALNKDSEELPWQNAMVNRKEQVTFNDLIEEQGKKSLSFEELRSLADGIEWSCTLDEILELLD